MDIATHALTGAVTSTFFDEPSAKIACIIGSLLPDITLFPIYAHKIVSTKSVQFLKFVSYLGDDDPYPPPKALMFIYFGGHSFTLFIFLALISIQNTWMFAFTAGFLTHVILDIPTHSGFWANKPFFPFSNIQIKGVGNWWKNHNMKRTLIPFWILLTILFIVLSKR